MLVKEFLLHNTCYVRNGNFLKMRVSEIHVKQIRVNQGLGVNKHILHSSKCLHKTHFNTPRALLAHPNYCRNKDLNRSIKCKINTLACNIVVANAAKVYWVQIFFKHVFIFSCSKVFTTR